MKYKTVIFDVDSTLVTIEGMVELAKMKGLDQGVSKITEQGMNGEISFSKSFTSRIDLVKPSLKDLDWLGDYYYQQLTPGAKETIEVLKKQDVRIVLISGSFQRSLDVLGKKLGLQGNDIFGVELIHSRNGKYESIDDGQLLVNDFGKLRLLETLKLPHPILMVGDGITDLECQKAVDYFVGFGGVVERTVVRNSADAFLTDKNLQHVLQYVQ
ncbi:HAD-IB family phosphatase [candidate division WWE3 bacterium]|uniref:phosphoserine phosphatase n=1 Tax=candidate division WWE3 bacterium TaxID=2053526 RepID=A0A955RQB4_UNCKA|nr:HAD-IB family phosphatase [candidate division WWE3 bacterium]